MKKLIAIFFAVIPFFVKGQAYLGLTFDELKQTVEGRPLETGFLTDGFWYAKTNYDLGTFVYCFSNEGHIVLCYQVPFNQGCVNAQAESYNNKYTITSNTTWVAYLANGGIMHIAMIYNEELETFIFKYQ
jgi:hypothetical protein